MDTLINEYRNWNVYAHRKVRSQRSGKLRGVKSVGMNVSRSEDEKVFVRGGQVDLIIFHKKNIKAFAAPTSRKL